MNTARAANTMMVYRAGQPPAFAASSDDPKNDSPSNYQCQILLLLLPTTITYIAFQH